MFKKIFLIVSVLVVLVLLVVGIGVFWALHKVNSPEFKHFVEAKISETTGVSLEFEKLRVGFSDTEILNLSIPAAGDEKFLQVKNLKVHYNILKLLGSPLTVAKIEIDDPTLILRQDAGGNLILPFEKAPPSVAAAPSVEPKESAFISLPEIYVRNASLSIFDADQSLLFGAAQAYVQASYAKLGNGQQAAANLSVKKIHVTPGLNLNDFTSPLTFKGNKLSLDKIQAVIYGGTLTGGAGVDLGAAPQTFNATAVVSQANLGALLADLGSEPDTVSGKFDLNFIGSGNLDAPKNLTGSGNLLIPSPAIGKLKTYQKLTQIIGTLGGISFLKEGKFDDVKANFAIGDQKLQLNPLAVNSANLTVNLAGPVTFDKQLDLKGDVILAPGILQVAQTVENIVNAVNALKKNEAQAAGKTPDQLKFPLTVSGPASDPKIGLDTGSVTGGAPQTAQDKAQTIINGLSKIGLDTGNTPAPAADNNAPQTAQEKTQNVINSLSNLFGPKKTEEPKPAPAPQPAP